MEECEHRKAKELQKTLKLGSVAENGNRTFINKNYGEGQALASSSPKILSVEAEAALRP